MRTINPIYVEHMSDTKFDRAMKSGSKSEKEVAFRAVETEKNSYKLAFIVSFGFWMLVIAGIIWTTIQLISLWGIGGVIFNPITMIIGFFCFISEL